MLSEHPLEDALRSRISLVSRSAQPPPELAAWIDFLRDMLAFADRAVIAMIGVLVGAKPLVLPTVLGTRRKEPPD
jgi:hypothetical protein